MHRKISQNRGNVKRGGVKGRKREEAAYGHLHIVLIMVREGRYIIEINGFLYSVQILFRQQYSVKGLPPKMTVGS